jgi:hypothetical protein
VPDPCRWLLLLFLQCLIRNERTPHESHLEPVTNTLRALRLQKHRVLLRPPPLMRFEGRDSVRPTLETDESSRWCKRSGWQHMATALILQMTKASQKATAACSCGTSADAKFRAVEPEPTGTSINEQKWFLLEEQFSRGYDTFVTIKRWRNCKLAILANRYERATSCRDFATFEHRSRCGNKASKP